VTSDEPPFLEVGECLAERGAAHVKEFAELALRREPGAVWPRTGTDLRFGSTGDDGMEGSLHFILRLVCREPTT
jgi:hypothetical protein